MTITGTPGTWQFNASYSGYNATSWSQSISATGQRDAYLTTSGGTADYPGATWIPAADVNHGTANRSFSDVRWIVIHTTEGTTASAVARFQNGLDPSYPSAHYIISLDGSIIQMVHNNNASYAAGNLSYNDKCINIEHERYSAYDCTAAQYQASAALVKWLMTQYNISMAFPYQPAGIAPADPTLGSGIIGHIQVPDPYNSSLGGGSAHHTDPVHWDWPHYQALIQGTPVATPVISPGSTSATGPVTVSMSCATSGATIRYTTNGSDPTSSSTVYGGSFTQGSSATVKARAFKSGMSDSAVASATYTIITPDFANNNFANRAAIGASGGTVTGSNVSATKESGEPNHAGYTGGKSVWWTWTPSANGTATISTAGSNFDTLLAVYTGGAVSGLTQVANGSNDDYTGTTSQVTISVTAGVAYQIAVDGYGGASGSISLRVTPPVVANPVATPVISPGSTSATGPVTVSMSCATSGATIRYTTNGSDPTSSSTVYGGSFTQGSSATVKARAFKSGMSDSAVASATYTIITPDFANNNFANRAAIGASGGTVTGSNVSATKESGEPNHAGYTGGKSVWWTWTPSANGTATISTAGSNFDTLLAVYTGGAVSGLTQVANGSNDDYTGTTSQVTISVTAGVAYQIAVDGYSGDSGSLSLRVTPPVVGNQLITQAQCAAILGHSISDSMLNDLNACLVRFSINTPARIRHFISQCAYESSGLTHFIEGDNYGDQWNYLNNRTDLGNGPTDGPTYRGVGAIQVTGRSMYQAFANYIGNQQVMQGCQYVAINYPFTISGFWWQQKGMNAIVDSGASCQYVSYRVNGQDPAIGLAERLRYYNICVQVIP